MRMFSPSSSMLNEDNADSNHEDLLIPANLAPTEEAAVSKVSPPASLKGFCVTFWAPDASRQAQQTLLHASHNSVNARGGGMPESAFWSRQGQCTDLSKGHFCMSFQVLGVTLIFVNWLFFLHWWGAPYIPTILCSCKETVGMKFWHRQFPSKGPQKEKFKFKVHLLHSSYLKVIFNWTPWRAQIRRLNFLLSLSKGKAESNNIGPVLPLLEQTCQLVLDD